MPVFCYRVVSVESKFDLGFIRSKYNREQYEPKLILATDLSIDSLCSILEICLVVSEVTYADGWTDRQTSRDEDRQTQNSAVLVHFVQIMHRNMLIILCPVFHVIEILTPVTSCRYFL